MVEYETRMNLQSYIPPSKSSNPVTVTLHPLPCSLQVTYQYERRNYEGAKKASMKALYFNIAALMAGIAIWIIVIGIFVGFLSGILA